MTPQIFNRLHALRMENDEARYDQEEMRPRFECMASRHENGTAPRAVSAFQLFQTPPELAARLVGLLSLKAGDTVLEPSAGLGRLLDALKPYQPAHIVAVEMAAQCAGELYRQERPQVTIMQRDFLTVSPSETGLFDAVVMNPPFHMRADIRHIKHALSFLKPGGRLAAICFDTEHRRRELKPMASQWIEVEGPAFKKEGTKVPTAIVVIQK